MKNYLAFCCFRRLSNPGRATKRTSFILLTDPCTATICFDFTKLNFSGAIKKTTFMLRLFSRKSLCIKKLVCTLSNQIIKDKRDWEIARSDKAWTNRDFIGSIF